MTKKTGKVGQGWATRMTVDAEREYQMAVVRAYLRKWEAEDEK